MPAPLSASPREGQGGCGVGHSTRLLGTEALAGKSLLLPPAARGSAAEMRELFLLCRPRALLRASEHHVLRPLPRMRSRSPACACSRSDFSSPKLNLCSQECAEMEVQIPTNVKARFFLFVPPLFELYMIKIHLLKWLFPLSNSFSKRPGACSLL